MNSYWPRDRIMPRQIYTRRKRFRKYLQRANRQQSANTVPEETWVYLMDRQPFRNAGAVYACLKSARHLSRKCYDSLPLICHHLCKEPVPSLSEKEVNVAMDLFDRIDQSVEKGPFISYLYCLEYILRQLGREDMVAYINHIKCAKRRRAYKQRLDGIFLRGESVALQLQVPGEPRLAPDRPPGFQVRNLTRDKPCRRVGAGAGGLRKIGLNEDLVKEDFGGALALHLLKADEVHRRGACALRALASKTHPFVNFTPKNCVLDFKKDSTGK